jgi:hypothetical protein
VPGDDPFELDEVYEAGTLSAVEQWAPADEHEAPELASRLSTWSRTTITGMVLSGWALGLAEVLDPKAERRIVIEVDASGEPHDLPVQLFLDPDDPSGTLCIVRRPEPPAPLV